MFRESPGCSLVMCVRHCKLNNCSREKNVNRQTTDGGCHINFDTQLKRKTLGPAHTKRNGCTRTMRRTEGFYRCKRCWLKLLTLTALALKEMKKSRGIEEGEESKGTEKEEKQEEAREERKREDKSSHPLYPPSSAPLCLYFCSPTLSFSLSLTALSFSLSGRPWLRPNVICFLIFIIHLANECFALLIKEQTMDVCPSLFLSHTHTQ